MRPLSDHANYDSSEKRLKQSISSLLPTTYAFKTSGRLTSTRPGRLGSLLICGIIALYIITRKKADLLPRTYGRYTWAKYSSAQPRLPYYGSSGLAQHCPRNDFSCKVDNARTSFKQLQVRQSTNVDEARREYQRRYRRLPPPGFDKWFQVASDNDAVLIDEYDRIELDLTPFRKAKIGKARMKRRMANAIKADAIVGVNNDLLGFVSILNGTATYGGRRGGPMSVPVIQSLLASVIADIPDVTVLQNYFSGPRIVAAPRHGEQMEHDDSVSFTNYRRRSTWDVVSEACKYHDELTLREQYGEASSASELCNFRPSQIRGSHGFFVSQNDFFPTDTLIPLLSYAKISTMHDILVPNLCYGSEDYRQFHVHDAVAFQDKGHSFYWRGSTTGLYASQQNWRSGHRQRFVAMAQWINETSEAAKAVHYPTIGPSALSKAAKVKALEDIFEDDTVQVVSQLPGNAIDVAFMAFFNCEKWACWEMEQSLPHSGKQDPRIENQHQLLGDIDGEGMSCRFYRFLNSNSLPIKQTIYAEWHDERLKPWLHYVPLSMGMEELPGLLTWLLSTEDGQVAAKEMAMAGKEWSDRALRPIDITLYYYRLLLELASIFNDH